MNKPAEKTRSTVSFNTTVFINFSDEDFKLMTHCLNNGYPEMEKHVAVGGFWYGYTNTRKWLDTYEPDEYDEPDPEAYTIELTFRQVDTLLKALEPRWFWIGQYKKQADKLAKLLYDSLTAANEQTKLAREQFEKTLTIE